MQLHLDYYSDVYLVGVVEKLLLQHDLLVQVYPHAIKVQAVDTEHEVIRNLIVT